MLLLNKESCEMNGTRYLLDTNAVISIVNGNKQLIELLNSASFIAFSIISIIEFLSYSNLTEKDKSVFQNMVEEASVINLRHTDSELIESIITIRKSYKIKLPDAIVAATALAYNCKIIYNDKELNKIEGLSFLSF